MSYALILYYAAELAGALILMTRLIRRLLPLPVAPNSMHLLLALGAFPVLVTWGGFLGLFRLPFLAPLLGLSLAVFAVFSLILHGPALLAKLGARQTARRYWLLALMCAVFLGMFVYSHHCYFDGGINNFDESVRGVPFTVAFAANWLKPAYPIDLSIPISYGYYYYQWSAFLYDSVDGYLWPSLSLFLISLLANGLFYVVLPQILFEFIDRPRREIIVVAILAVSFAGPDFLFNRDLVTSGNHDWWQLPHIVLLLINTGTTEYHYLVTFMFGLSALVCLRRAMNGGPASYLVASAAFIALALTFATLSGAFYLIVVAIAASLLTLGHWLHPATILRAVPAATMASLVILLPQVFTFIHRSAYLTWADEPALWFTHVPFAQVTLKDLYSLSALMLKCMGPLAFLGFLAIPAYLVQAWRSGDAFRVIAVLSLLAGMTVSLSFIHPRSPDWYWRSGIAGLLIAYTLGATWLFGECRKQRYLKPLAIPAVAILLILSSEGFFAHDRMHAQNCIPLNSEMAEINRLIDLHTAVTASGVYMPKVFQAGRAVVTPDFPLADHMTGYRQPLEVLHRWFDWPEKFHPCRTTWYGASIPEGNMAHVSGTPQDVTIHFEVCDAATPAP